MKTMKASVLLALINVGPPRRIGVWVYPDGLKGKVTISKEQAIDLLSSYNDDAEIYASTDNEQIDIGA